MTHTAAQSISNPEPLRPIGVGLRHTHYHDVLQSPGPVDFFEVHSENFFAPGSVATQALETIAAHYPLSLHGTAMGLGSATGIDAQYLAQLKQLVDHFEPIFVSDHASFSWVELAGKRLHMGDLLPLPFSPESLNVLAENVDRAQQFLGRQILVENLVSYLTLSRQPMSETEFFTRLMERTGCGLLVDLNNLLVNARNRGSATPLEDAQQWLRDIPSYAVTELHLAGYTEVGEAQLIIDDHSQPVSEECWALYAFALQRFSKVATLIEWDNNLPQWQELEHQAEIAAQVAQNSWPMSRNDTHHLRRALP